MATVYLSSTYEDLADFREAAIAAIRQTGHVVVGSDSGPTPETSLAEALAEVSKADVFVGIIAHRYGFVPQDPGNPEGRSFVELAYQEAGRRRMPRLIYLLSPDAPWPVRFVDEDATDRRKLTAFREQLKRETIVGSFTTPTELALNVTASLRAQARLARMAEPHSDRPEHAEAFFSYNMADRAAVRSVADRLRSEGVRVWMDEIALTAGDDWWKETDAAFADANLVVIFGGASGIGPKQQREVDGALARVASDPQFRVVPALLPGAIPQRLPPDLLNYYWVDFRESVDDANAYGRLKDAILRRPGRPPGSGSPAPVLDDAALALLPELLFRLVAKRHERPELLRSLDPTTFWAAVRKAEPTAATVEDLKSLNARLAGEPGPGPLWVAWMKRTRSLELGGLLHHFRA